MQSDFINYCKNSRKNMKESFSYVVILIHLHIMKNLLKTANVIVLDMNHIKF